MPRSRANELSELVLRLGSRNRAAVDAARARLAIIGPRAVDILIDALEGGEARLRARVMPLLALIQDGRARGPLLAMLLDRSSRLREIAARSLGRFSSDECVAALSRAFSRERSERVRIAIVQSLIDQYDAGQDQALCHVLEVMHDRRLPRAVRIAALSLLPKLRPGARRSIVQQLAQDADAGFRESLTEKEKVAAVEAEPQQRIRATLDELGAADYAVWNRAVECLASIGVAVVEPLAQQMQSRSHDPDYCKRAGMAFRAMGPRRARAIADAMERVSESLPLQVMIETIGTLGERAQIYRLKELLDRLAARERAADWDPLQRARAMAHLELARIGSRVAIADLRDALADRDRRIELELLSAVELVGNREEIPVLLAAFAREDDLTRERVREAVLKILKRERIRRNHTMFRDLGREQRRALMEILPPLPPRRSPRSGSAPTSEQIRDASG